MLARAEGEEAAAAAARRDAFSRRNRSSSARWYCGENSIFLGVSGGRNRLGEAGEGDVDDEAEAVVSEDEDDEEAELGECMAIRMRRAVGEADVMGDGGTAKPASDEAVEEASEEAADEPFDTFSVSCFFGVTFAAADADDPPDDDAAPSTFFRPTGVTATGLLRPDAAAASPPADDEPVNVLTILLPLLLLPLGEFSTARRRALSLVGSGDVDLDEAVRRAERSRASERVLSAVSRCGCWGLCAGCLVASIRGESGEWRSGREWVVSGERTTIVQHGNVGGTRSGGSGWQRRMAQIGSQFVALSSPTSGDERLSAVNATVNRWCAFGVMQSQST